MCVKCVSNVCQMCVKCVSKIIINLKLILRFTSVLSVLKKSMDCYQPLLLLSFNQQKSLTFL